MSVGKCPKCGEPLNEEDIKETKIKGITMAHYASVCKKCATIIGLGPRYGP